MPKFVLSHEAEIDIVGIVIPFKTSNAPVFKNRDAIAISNLDPRVLVVRGISVMSKRLV
jgi:hypothetical protein